MFAFRVTPGLSNRTFGAAARLAYLRFGVLLIGARVPIGGGGGRSGTGGATPLQPSGQDAPPSADDGEAAYQVLLFPCELMLTAGE
jgi:hypothetical protein